MWWEPETERERILRSDVARLTDWFGEASSKETRLSWGVGSVMLPFTGERYPFILLNAVAKPVGGFVQFPEEMPSLRSLYQLRVRDSEGRLPRTELPLVGLAVNRPMPMSAWDDARDFARRTVHPGGLLVCRRTGSNGTAAVRVVSSDGREALLTAAHTFPDGVGSEVDQRRSRWLGRLSRSKPLGAVSHHILPRPGQPGWDVALIAPDGPLPPRLFPPIQCHEGRPSEESVFALGARSGFVRRAGVLNAALNVQGDDRILWKNCWMVAPSGALRSGDSGAAVFTLAQRRFLGIYVGASRIQGQPIIHYVQDGKSILDHVLRAWAFSYS